MPLPLQKRTARKVGYADEDYDRYERLIERYCHRFGFDGDYGLFEDACTDARIFGHGIG